jgi:hypothetical protein
MLRRLCLAEINLKGKVPWVAICSLKKLEELDLRLNVKLNPSVVPPEIAQLTKLKVFTRCVAQNT